MARSSRAARPRDDRTTKQERQTAAVQKYAPRIRRVNPHDVAVLARLARFRDTHGSAYARVWEVGGSMQSHHSNTLGKLAVHRLVDVAADTSARSPLVYRINRKGMAALRAVRAVK